jgi:hypothetical protein
MRSISNDPPLSRIADGMRWGGWRTLPLVLHVSQRSPTTRRVEYPHSDHAEGGPPGSSIPGPCRCDNHQAMPDATVSGTIRA